MDEIRETDIDRAAMAILLRGFPGTSVDAATATIGLLNETWSRMARRLAVAPDEDFDALERTIVEERQGRVDFRADLANRTNARFTAEDAEIAAYDRALELLGLIVEWRAETWAAQEGAEGRDPYMVAEPDGWTPPRGWIPPVGS